jgi:hypothetical protein
MKDSACKCGQPHITPWGHPSCKAHRSKTGDACRANPVRGAAVCGKHGGSIGAVKRKAAERVATEKLNRTVGDLMQQFYRPDEHPWQALLDASRTYAAMTRAIEHLVQAAQANADNEALPLLLGMHDRHARLAASVQKMTLDANLQERMTQIEEAKTELLFREVRGAILDVGLSPSQAEALRVALAKRLRALPSA